MRGQPGGERPWAAVLGLSLDQLVAWGVLYYSYGVLAVPMSRDLGVPTSTVAAAFSGCLLVSSLLARRVGVLLDRRGARPVLLYGAIIAPLAFGGLAAVDAALPLLLVFAVLGIGQAFSLYEPAFRAVVDWFPVPQPRSRALLVLTSVAGFASTVFMPLTVALLDAFGWRFTVLALAALTAAVTLPIRLLLPRQPSSDDPCRTSVLDSASLPPAAFTKLLSGGFALQAFAATGATVCLVWQLVERGETLKVAAALAGLAGASQVPGRLLLSPLSSVVSTEVRLPLLLVVQGVAVVGIAVLSGPAVLVAVMTFGAAAGVMTLERAAVVIEWFGRDAFGSGSGRLASAALLARASAPFAVELVHGSFSYSTVLGLLAGCLLIGSTLITIATRVRRRANGRDPRRPVGTS
ncbi:MAG TPA: MFS transporter [Polyangiaceae bacterium]|jgi:MFS family permease|nr:MFS transporter [Polyangiaceae bacterium]